MVDTSHTNAESHLTGGMLSYLTRPMNDQRTTPIRMVPHLDVEPDAEPPSIITTDIGSLRIGLIDSRPFSQECLIKAFTGLHPNLTVLTFATVRDCLGSARDDMDLIIYHFYGSDTSEAAITRTVTTVCQAFPTVPLIVLSDEEDSQQFNTVRVALKSGARGFIPTRSAGLPMVFAAIRLVKAGGTFVPIDLLLANQPDQTRTQQNHLTSRQTMVLALLRQGKANKIIAYELGMSESTVKIHVRNLMRKLGATNRTQVAYKAEQFLCAGGHPQAADA